MPQKTPPLALVPLRLQQSHIEAFKKLLPPMNSSVLVRALLFLYYEGLISHSLVEKAVEVELTRTKMRREASYFKKKPPTP